MKVLNQELEAVAERTFSWTARPDNLRHLYSIPTMARRIAYVITEPEIHSKVGKISCRNGAAVIDRCFAHLGVPVRNQLNTVRMEWGGSPFVLTLRGTDSFGEVLIYLDPASGTAAAWSITIDRALKGGVSYPSPRPEEQMIQRLGSFTFEPVGKGVHQVDVKAVEGDVLVHIDGRKVLSVYDPDVAAGCFGIGSHESVRLLEFEQTEYITRQEAESRERLVREMNAFCTELDSEYEADIARANSLSVEGNALIWRYPETGAMVELEATAGSVTAVMHAGLYGNARLLAGPFAMPEVTDESGDVYRADPDAVPALTAEPTGLRMDIPLVSRTGLLGAMRVSARFTENATWFWTAEANVASAARDPSAVKASVAFGLDRTFVPNWPAAGPAGEAAKMVYGTSTIMEGVANAPESTAQSFLCTDGVVGHFWKALSGQDTLMSVERVDGVPALVVRSERPVFRWATMWLPYHKLNLTGYKKRMLHFIRYPETPNHEWRERPSVCEYPTDEELERFAANGVRAMVWHHTWTGNNFRRREGFVVNDSEMRRAMKKAHSLGIEVIPYIGIVPGRHPVLRYEDLSTRCGYDKNWDLQDFTFYSVAGRFAEFFPYMTDYWCREYGIDGFYTDGGIALLDWGNTGLSEADFGGLSLEELNDRLYSRVKRVLRRHKAGFGLENWGGSPIHLVGPFYECRMIGESFQETSPESYRDGYNPLLTGTPFKMYAMDLDARGRYNIAMAAVCMTDQQMCSGNYAWGNWPDMPSDWANLRPFWSIMDSIDWDHLIEARPWWAQKLLSGEGFYAGYYMTPGRVVLFLTNRTEEKARVTARLQLDQLPESLRGGTIRQIYPEHGEWTKLGDGQMRLELPRLHDGPVGFEIAVI